MKRSFLVAVSAAAALMAFASCGNKTVSSSAEFVINNGTEPQSLDPTQIEGVPEDRIYKSLFEGLVTYDPKTCEAVPGVAESWKVSADGLTITYHLRKTAWSDGTPITAQTFVDSWLYYLAPETAAAYAYMPASVIKGAAEYNEGTGSAADVGLEAVDEYTFKVYLTGPAPYAVNMMSHYSFSPLPLHAMKKFGQDWTKPGNFVGNGPFTLLSWTPQEKIEVVKNDSYWNKENVFLSKITFLPIEDESVAYNKFKNGEIDWSPSVNLELLDEIKLRDDYHCNASLSSYYYEFNINDPTLSDVRVRKALAMAINKKDLVEKVTRGGQIAADAFVPPMNGYQPASGNTYNVEKAKALLAEAGYPEGKGFPKMTLIYNTNEGHKKIAEFVQQQWKENLGISIELQNMEWNTFLATRQSNDFQIARAGWVGDYADPTNFLELLLSSSGNNDGRYNNVKFDNLLDKAKALPDGAERNAVLKDAENICITEDQAIIPFYYYVSQNMIDTTKWEGWYENTLDAHPYIGLKAAK